MPGDIPHGTLTGHICHQLLAEPDDAPCASVWVYWRATSETPGYPTSDEFNAALVAARTIIAP